MSAVKYPGTAVTLNDGNEYVLPPLPLGKLRELREQIKVAQQPPDAEDRMYTDEQLAAMGEVFFGSFARNYPDVPKEQALDLFDLNCGGKVLLSIFKISGLVKKPGEEAPPAGE